MLLPHHCTLCPRACGLTAPPGSAAFAGPMTLCGWPALPLHHWEEPCLSGDPDAATGSGTVFFCGCTLRCCYCQNFSISQGSVGKEITPERLAGIFLTCKTAGPKI